MKSKGQQNCLTMDSRKFHTKLAARKDKISVAALTVKKITETRPNILKKAIVFFYT